MKEILLALTEEHYVKSEPSTHPEHLGDIVHVFKIFRDIIPTFDEEVDYGKS